MEIVIAYLILAHLLADFIFQPYKLVQWKNHSLLGLTVHVMIHLIFNFLLLLPLILNGHHNLIWAIILICGIHFAVDQIKILYDTNKKHEHNKVKPFLIDQLMHFLVIFSVMIFIGGSYEVLSGTFYDFYLRKDIPIVLSLVIIFSASLEILLFEKQLEKGKTAEVKLYNRKSLLRGLSVIILYSIYFFIDYFA